MNSRLTRRLNRAITQSGMNMREIAEQAGVPYGWVRQMKVGGIARPDADRLRKVAPVLGIPVDELLALTDQLGEATATKEPGPSGDVTGLMAAMTAALEATARTLTDVRLELGVARREAQEQREASAELLGALSRDLAELRALVETRAGSAAPGSPGLR